MSSQNQSAFDENFFIDFCMEISEYLKQTTSSNNSITQFKSPKELKYLIDFEIQNEGITNNKLLEQLKLVTKYQTKSNHKHFHNQLYGGFDKYSTIGNMLSTAINSAMFTYEIAPVFTVMQSQIYEHLRQLIGWQTIDGIMTPGGSFSNWMGMQMARHSKFPQTKLKGICGLPQMKIFTSNHAHYSIDKGAILQGFGIQNVVKIKSNVLGQMISSDLRQKIIQTLNNGEIPLFVNSTAGTTVSGAIDPIQQIGQICKQFGIWHHVDAALGGAFLISPILRQKIGDLSNVDSICWDTHKALPIPLQATFFLCKQSRLMQSCNSMKANYLFHEQRRQYDRSLDTGDKSLQCGRLPDILKVWTYFKAHGWKGVSQHIQKQHNLSNKLFQKLQQKQQQWLIVYPSMTFNVCAFYIPQQLRNKQHDQQFFQKLSKVTTFAKKILLEQGKLMVSYSTNEKGYYFWRFVMLNPSFTQQDIEYELQILMKTSEKAYLSLYN